MKLQRCPLWGRNDRQPLLCSEKSTAEGLGSVTQQNLRDSLKHIRETIHVHKDGAKGYSAQLVARQYLKACVSKIKLWNLSQPPVFARKCECMDLSIGMAVFSREKNRV